VYLPPAVNQTVEVRAYLPKTGLEEIASYDVPTPLDLENRTMMMTRVYRFLSR